MTERRGPGKRQGATLGAALPLRFGKRQEAGRMAGRITALREFQRLESTGLWRSSPEAQRREVVVAFGEATLVIAEGNGRPLSHWSLPAIDRLNPGETPARYAPDEDGSEELEIEDAVMVEAIEKVRGAVLRARPRPRLLRRSGILGGAALILAAALVWLPGAMKRQALALVPETSRSGIGAAILGLMARETGPACRDQAGVAALEAMIARLYGPGSGISAVVLPQGPQAPALLPGQIVVLPLAAIAGTDDPLVLAGDVVATLAAAGGQDPLRPVLDSSGVTATMRLLATGELPASSLQAHADLLLATPPGSADTDGLIAAFSAAGLPTTPWAEARQPENAMALIEADPLAGQQPAPVISDTEWVGLQGICD